MIKISMQYIIPYLLIININIVSFCLICNYSL